MALADKRPTAGSALKQLLHCGLSVFSVDPGGMVCKPSKVWLCARVSVCKHKSTGAFEAQGIMGECMFCVSICFFETERKSFYLYRPGIVSQLTPEYHVIKSDVTLWEEIKLIQPHGLIWRNNSI